MAKNNKWKLIKRSKVLDTKYLKIYEDKVRLPNGKTIPDFTVVQKPDVVLIVATDKKNNLVTIREYKHAVNKIQWALPAGMIDRANEVISNTAKRELEEETGFTTDNLQYLGFLNDYPSKDMHKIHVFRATNVIKKSNQNLEDGETITQVSLIPIKKVKEQIINGKWESTSAIAALAISGLLF